VRKANWLEQMREKKEQRQPSALQKQAAEAHTAAGSACLPLEGEIETARI